MLVRVIDVETTGIDPALHRIVEIATVDVVVHGGISDSADADKGKDVTPKVERGRLWSSLVNPGMPIPPEASAVHDIVADMVKDAPMMADLLDIGTITEGSPDYYCAHNSRFDSKFVYPKDSVWLDTYRIALWLWPQAPEHKNSTLRYWLRLNLAMPSEVDGKRSHSALWDAYVTAAILRRAFMTGATIEQMVEVSSIPALLPRFTFGKHAMQPIEEVPAGYLDWILTQRDMDEDVKHTAFAELSRRRNLEHLAQR